MKRSRLSALVLVTLSLSNSGLTKATESFAERCDRLLADARIQIRFEDKPVNRTLSLSRTELEALSGQASGSHRHVLGLTHAEPSARLQVKVRMAGIEDGSVCAVPSIELVLGLKRLDVHLAKELRGECQRAIVEAHETEHVAVWRNHLRAGARLATPMLQERLVQMSFHASAADAETDLRQRSNEEINRLMARLIEGINAEHRQIDSPGSYQTVQNSLRACP